MRTHRDKRQTRTRTHKDLKHCQLAVGAQPVYGTTASLRVRQILVRASACVCERVFISASLRAHVAGGYYPYHCVFKVYE